MSSTDNDCIEILKDIIAYIYRYGNLAIYILGTIGNLLNIFVFFKKSWRKNVCVFYFLICLILNLIYLNSVILGTTFIIGFNINLQNSSVILCKLLHYTALFSSTLLPTVLILASIDRLLISSQNVDTRLYSSKRLAYFSISISTVFWIVFNLHILIKVNIQKIDSSYFICYYDLSKPYLDFIGYSFSVINVVFCILMIILSIFSFKNVDRIRSIPRQQRKQIRAMTKKDFQLIRCLFVHDILYISVSLLPSLYSIYKIATKDQTRTLLEQGIIDFLDDIFTFIYFGFYCSSFFIFLCVSKSFRNAVKRLIFGKNLMVSKEKEQNVDLNIAVVSRIVLSS